MTHAIAVGFAALLLLATGALAASPGGASHAGDAAPARGHAHGHQSHPHAGSHSRSHGGQPHASDAASYRAGSLLVETPWSRATPGGASVAGGFMRITNEGAEPDRLVDGSVELAARVELHASEIADGVARMRPLEAGLPIAPGETIELRPGGYHLMFLDIERPLREGETIAGTLVFEKAGRVEIAYRVLSIGARGEGAGHAH